MKAATAVAQAPVPQALQGVVSVDVGDGYCHAVLVGDILNKLLHRIHRLGVECNRDFKAGRDNLASL